ncbi:MAG: PD-(D/E)XK nuclease family protein [Myxococcota bacterium]
MVQYRKVQSVTLWPSSSALLGLLRQRASRSGASLALRDGVLGDFVAYLAARSRNRAVVDPAACALLLHDVVKDLASSLTALPTGDPTFHEHAQNAIASAKEAQVTPTDLLGAAGMLDDSRCERLTALARLYGVYETRKQERGLADAADALPAAVEALSDRDVPVPSHVEVRGLLDITQARLVFLRALARRARVTLHLPHVSDRPTLGAYLEPVLQALEGSAAEGLVVEHHPLGEPGGAMSALADALFTPGTAPSAPAVVAALPDVRSEAEAVADWCLRQLQAGSRPQDLAVIVRRPSERDALLVDALAARGLVLWRRKLDLRQCAFARGVTRLLRAAEGRIHVQELESLAELAGAMPSVARAFATRLAPQMRAAGQSGRAAEVLARHAEGHPEIMPLALALRALAEVAPVEEHARRLDDALLMLRGLRSVTAPTSSLAQAAMEQDVLARNALDEGLRALQTSARRAGHGQMARVVFASHVEAMFAAVPVAPPAHGIELCSAPDVAGRRFSSVAVMGMADGIFPEPTSLYPLLSDEDRHALNKVLGRAAFRTEDGEGALRAPPRDRLEPLLFALAVGSAAQSLLVTTSENALDGRQRSASPFFLELLRTLGRAAPDRPPSPAGRMTRRRAAGVAARQAQPDAEPELVRRTQAIRSRWRKPDGAHGGIITGALAAQVARRYGGTREHPTSATSLERYGRCPFLVVVDNMLGIAPTEPAENAPGADVLGELAHKVLEDYVRDRLGRPLEAPTPDEKQWIRAKIMEGRGSMGGNPAITEAVLETLAEQVIRTITEMAHRPVHAGAKPVAVEHGFGWGDAPFSVELPGMDPLFVRGRMDRVDELVDGTMVAWDYKSGSAAHNADMLSNASLGYHHLQLPLYLLALRAGGAPGAIGYLWSIRDGRATSPFGSLGRFSLEEVMVGSPQLKHPGMEQRLVQITHGLREGRFPVEPEKGACRFCDHFSVCRVQETRPPPEDDEALLDDEEGA